MRFSIKTWALILLSMTLFSTYAAADSLYVTDKFEITMRTGPRADRKIIALIPSGRKLEVLSSSEDWTQVLLPNGKQGWVLTRYLTPKEPSSLILKRLQQQHDQLLDENKSLKQKFADLDLNSKRLTEDLKSSQTTLDQLTSTHETLKKESSDFLKLKAKYKKAEKAKETARKTADELQNQVIELKGNEFNKGLLYGGGYVLMGIILGFIFKRPKRKSGLL